MRLDDDSFIFSPINYNVFDFMKKRGYNYGFRACSYEMQSIRKAWWAYAENNSNIPEVKKTMDKEHSTFHNGKLKEACGFYNNWSVADIQFFMSPKVQQFLRWIDDSQEIYTNRLGDLQIHTAAVSVFSPIDRIYRFTDFSYQHMTYSGGCPFYGVIQQGYNDVNCSVLIRDFVEREVVANGCPLRLMKGWKEVGNDFLPRLWPVRQRLVVKPQQCVCGFPADMDGKVLTLSNGRTEMVAHKDCEKVFRSPGNGTFDDEPESLAD